MFESASVIFLVISLAIIMTNTPCESKSCIWLLRKDKNLSNICTMCMPMKGKTRAFIWYNNITYKGVCHRLYPPPPPPPQQQQQQQQQQQYCTIGETNDENVLPTKRIRKPVDRFNACPSNKANMRQIVNRSDGYKLKNHLSKRRKTTSKHYFGEIRNDPSRCKSFMVTMTQNCDINVPKGGNSKGSKSRAVKPWAPYFGMLLPVLWIQIYPRTNTKNK